MELNNIREMSFSDLLSLRDYFKKRVDECTDKVGGITRFDCFETKPYFVAELERLDKFIIAKYDKLKNNSIKK